MDWTDEVIDRLRAFWAAGVSTAEIGRRLGVSKNAVVGKAHRLSLAARPSPIRRGTVDETPKRPAVRRVVGATLAPIALAAAEPKPLVVAPPPAVVSPPPILRAVHRAPGGRLVACCWPIGEPGTRSFRFCDAESLPGKPYCSAHAALAYVKVRDRREEAA